MQIDVGKFYFIKDEFFEIVNDRELMKNKENSIKRPCYYCFKSKENEKIIWFIPVSTKIEKYKKIYDKKIQKQKELRKNPSVDTIVFGYVANTYSTFLIQNMFPVTLKYIDHIHTKNGNPVPVNKKLQGIIKKNTKSLIAISERGVKVTFTDIIRLRNKLI